jgi:GH15 family glucan-1,4-alpha-glucosidase
VASALARMPNAEDDIRVSAWALQMALANHLCAVWRLPDEGIWEVRGGAKQFVHSKVMAWVALDRAIQMVEQGYGKDAEGRAGEEDVKRWKKVRATIHREVCAKGFDKKLNSFVQAYGPGSTRGVLDASCLRLALVGFLPATDPRILGTVEAIEKGLMRNGFVQRYKTRETEDGLTGGEGQFLACSFWMVENLWLIGRKEDARAMFERLLALRNDVGLLSEEYDSDAGRMVGNFPQALSHISLVHAAFAMSGTWAPQHGGEGACDDAKLLKGRGAARRKVAKGTTKGREKRS